MPEQTPKPLKFTLEGLWCLPRSRHHFGARKGGNIFDKERKCLLYFIFEEFLFFSFCFSFALLLGHITDALEEGDNLLEERLNLGKEISDPLKEAVYAVDVTDSVKDAAVVVIVGSFGLVELVLEVGVNHDVISRHNESKCLVCYCTACDVKLNGVAGCVGNCPRDEVIKFCSDCNICACGEISIFAYICLVT